MKGLLVKDLKTIMANNKTFLLMAIAIVFIFAFMDNPTFVLGYITVLCSMLVLSTLSYDELDNGFAFLFTLPITKKIYVKSKYLFSIVYTLAVWGIACIVIGVISAIKGYAMDVSFPVGVISSCYLFLAIMFPIQLKFGSEKSRIALAIIIGGLIAIGAGVVGILAFFGIYPEDIDLFTENMTNISTVLIVICILAVTMIILGVSYICSLRIIENKEF